MTGGGDQNEQLFLDDEIGDRVRPDLPTPATNTGFARTAMGTGLRWKPGIDESAGFRQRAWTGRHIQIQKRKQIERSRSIIER